jgi:Ger(x)C family germination protein
MNRLLALPLAAALLALAGCGSIHSGYREVEQLHLIQTIGIDHHPDGVTVSISSGQSTDVSSTAMAQTGQSITDAIRRLQNFSAREDIFFAHTRYAILGEETARRGISGCLDYFQRAGQIPMDIGLLVLRRSTAEELIRRSSAPSTSISELLRSLDHAAERDGASYVFSCEEISRALLEHGAALICAITAEDTEDVIFTEAGEKAAVPLGYGILKGDAVCGYITGETARGVNLLLGHGGIGEVPVEAGQTVSVNMRSGGCALTPRWAGGRLAALEIDVSLDCAIAELSSGGALTAADYAAITAAAEEKAAGWIREILELQRRLDADFLGLCNKIRMKTPREFAAAEADWPAALRDTDYRISVTAEIRRDYDLRAPEETAHE